MHDNMAAIRTYHHRDFPIAELCQKKARTGETISVVIPTLDEQSTIGAIVRIVREELMERYPLVDELIVVDSGSTDQTVVEAQSAGAVVYQASAICPEHGHYRGKGENLWKSQWVASGSVTVFVDGDIMNFHPGYISGLVGPLLDDPALQYVKAFYQRPLCTEFGDLEHEGGRVSELLIKPFFSLFYPELRALHQPLAGEYAVRRRLLAQLPFPTGYAVELAHLIDVLALHGPDVFAQCDLDSRRHRNRPLGELSEMASALLPTLLRRAERDGKLQLSGHWHEFGQKEISISHGSDDFISERRAIAELQLNPTTGS
jgi:glucosyl-3-phosphoglycerate synthase